MSLMQLLAVGRSIVGLRSDRGRFKMAPQGALPKFGSAPEGPAASVATEFPAVGASLENRRAAVVPTTTAVSPAPVAPPAIATRSAQPTLSSRIGALSKSFGNPFAALRAKSAHAAMIQSELALHGVKVVRNDLSDADLEVVSSNKGNRPVADVRNPFTAAPEKTAPAPERELASRTP